MPRYARQTAMEFAAALREARSQARATQQHVAAKAQISPTFLADMERGRRMPSVEVTAKLAEVLGLPAERLLRFHKEESMRQVTALADTHPEIVALLARLGARVAAGSIRVSELKRLLVERKEC